MTLQTVTSYAHRQDNQIHKAVKRANAAVISPCPMLKCMLMLVPGAALPTRRWQTRVQNIHLPSLTQFRQEYISKDVSMPLYS